MDQDQYPRPYRVIEVIPYKNAIPYSSSPDPVLPHRPETDIRPTGFLGLGANRQDESHHQRMLEIYYIGRESALAEQMAGALELTGIKQAIEAMKQAEELVYSQPQESVAGMLAADLAGDMAARARGRHARTVETYEAEVTNVIHRR